MKPTFIVIMGVSGCGKSTIAKHLATKINGMFLEGDAFHPPENKAKMGAGIPLQDTDRWPWFDRLIHAANAILETDSSPVLACSALKQAYRDYLFRNFSSHRLIYLQGSFDLIKSRMDAREHEYMTSDLLRSQFAILEEPTPGPDQLILSIELYPDEIIAAISVWLEQT
ncbi:MAG TPA: gluconokinase [Verrucomicrobiales bacterium]|nr:gluconokinase [Verrucomicrobiales bacterium]